MRRAQRGEISLTLSIIGILLSVIGIGLGATAIRTPQSFQSSAQLLPGDYPYRSILEIKDVNGNVVTWQPGFEWENEIIGGSNPGLSEGDVKDENCSQNCEARVVWNTGSVPQSLRGTTANVKIYVPEGYRVVEGFCTSAPRGICENRSEVIDPTRSSLQVNGLRIVSLADITYGVVVEEFDGSTPPPQTPIPSSTPQPTQTPVPTTITPPTQTPIPTVTPQPTVTTIPTVTPVPTGDPQSCEVRSLNCTPQNVRVDAVEDGSVTLSWGIPTNCPGYDSTNDRFWVDVVRQDGSDSSIVCATETPLGTVTCNLGYDVGNGRILDKNSQEYRTQKWQDGESYYINLYLRDTSGACVSRPGYASFSRRTPEPPPDELNLQYRFNQLGSNESQANAKTKLQEWNTNGSAVDTAENAHTNGRVYSMNIKKNQEHPFYTMSFWTKDVNKTISTHPNEILHYFNTSDELRSLCSAEKKIEIFNTDEDAGFRCSFTYAALHEFVQNREQSGQSTILDIYLVDDDLIGDAYTRKCKHVKGAGPHRVVISGDRFASEREVEDYAHRVAEQVTATNLTEEGLLGYLTFLYFDDHTIDHGCKVEDSFGSPNIDCHHTPITSIMNVCGAQYGVTIANITQGTGANASGDKSLRISKAHLEDNYTSHVVSHELGHAIARLSDEYVLWIDGEPISSGGETPLLANCTSESDGLQGCSKWSGSGGCFRGCWYEDYYRPSENSIMRSPQPAATFNQVSIEQWRRSLIQPPALASLTTDSTYYATLVITLRQPQRNVIEVLSSQVREGYPQHIEDLSQYGPYYYTVQLQDEKGTSLFETDVSSHLVQLHEPVGEPELMDSLTMYLPHFPAATTLVAFDPAGNQVLTYQLPQNVQEVPEFTGDLCGNSVCDAAIGETEHSCRVDCGAHLVKSEKERSDFDENGIVNGADLSIMLDDRTYQKTDEGDVDGDGRTNALDYSLVIKWLGSSILYTE